MRIPTIVSIAVLLCSVLNMSLSQEAGESTDRDVLLAQISSLNAEKDSLVRENVEIKKSKSQLEKNIENLTKKSSYILELGKLEEKYAQLESDTYGKISNLTEALSKTEKERDQARSDAIKAAEVQPNAEIEAEVAALRAKTSSLENYIQKTDTSLGVCTASNADLEAKLNDVRMTLHRTIFERDQLHSDVRAAGTMVTKAQKETHMTKDRYVVAAKTINEQSNTIKELELHHDKCRVVTNQLESKIGVLQLQLGRNPFTVFKEKIGELARKVFGWFKFGKKKKEEVKA